MAKYNKHDPAFKAKVALAALKGDKTLAELTKDVVRLSLEIFVDNVIDALAKSGLSLCVFPISLKDIGKIVDVNTFAEDLAQELNNYS